MPDPDAYKPSVDAARKRLGLEEGERFEDHLAQWRKLEMRLAWMAAGAANAEAKASYEKDLAELRMELRVFEQVPVPVSVGKSSWPIWVLLMGLLLGGGYLGFQKWSERQIAAEVSASALRGVEERFEIALEKKTMGGGRRVD